MPIHFLNNNPNMCLILLRLRYKNEWIYFPSFYSIDCRMGVPDRSFISEWYQSSTWFRRVTHIRYFRGIRYSTAPPTRWVWHQCASAILVLCAPPICALVCTFGSGARRTLLSIGRIIYSSVKHSLLAVFRANMVLTDAATIKGAWLRSVSQGLSLA